jgi:anhydro-N-acetylmuramic acid kinase
MKSSIEKLHQISNKKSRIIIGLMSGTSLDGLDIACCKIEGSGKHVKVELLEFCTMPYPDQFQQRIREMISSASLSLQELTLMNTHIASIQANLVNQAMNKWRISKENVDAIASHGQTIFHAPEIFHQEKEVGNATLQLGDGDHIAKQTGIITISDFRQKHVAHGGEGAPLAPYGDYLLFSSPNKNRILLNIGGISNITYLPDNAEFKSVIASDTGSGNCLMDAWVRKNFSGQQFDLNGEIAAKGKVVPELLNEMMNEKFFALPIPKTTGSETFNINWIEQKLQESSMQLLEREDVLATLNHLTAITICDCIKKVTSATHDCEIIISGGGIHNKTLILNISKLLPNVKISTANVMQINADAKEAILFALLANETLSGKEETFGEGNHALPNVSMGKICLPY